jgi:hypothetical protein
VASKRTETNISNTEGVSTARTTDEDTEMNPTEFRAYKIDRIRTHLSNSRVQRLCGARSPEQRAKRHTQAVWYQHLAGLARLTLTMDQEYLTAMRQLIKKEA